MSHPTRQHSALSAPTSVIRSVVSRVAGQISTEAFAHHFGTSSQQVGVRAGDTLTYVHAHGTAAAMARAFCDGLALAERHSMRWSVQPGPVGIEPTAVAPTLLLDFEQVPQWAVGFQVAREISGQPVPAHVWVRVGPVLWQVCDIVAAGRLADVWSHYARLLTPPRPSTAAVGRVDELSDQSESAGLTETPRTTGTPAAAATSGTKAPAPSGWTRAVDDRRSDIELLVAYADGDTDALGVLVVRRGGLVRGAVRRVLGERDGVEDAAQIAWLHVARSAHRFHAESAVTTWLWRIAYRAAIDLLRTTCRGGVTVALDLDNPTHQVLTAAMGEDDQITDTAVVTQLLDRLPAAQRAVVELIHLDGLTFAVTAERLGVAERTVKSREWRARARMAAETQRLGLRATT